MFHALTPPHLSSLPSFLPLLSPSSFLSDIISLQIAPPPPQVLQAPPLCKMNSSSSSAHVTRNDGSSVDILEELQLIAAQNLERLEVNKYYEVIRELGKGTYGKVDLVVHKLRGQSKVKGQTCLLHRHTIE